MYYAEVLFSEAFCKELFLLLLLFYRSRKSSKVVLVCFIFGIFAVFKPLFPMSVMFFCDLISLFVYPVVALKKGTGQYFLFTAAQLVALIVPLPAVFSICGILILVALRMIPYKSRREGKHYYTCEVTDGCRKVRTVAFFDSGNRVFAENGEPVVLADSSVYNKLSGDESDVYFSTLAGCDVVPCKEGTLFVYGDGKKVRYKAKVARSPKKLFHCGLILHGDMIGGM